MSSTQKSPLAPATQALLELMRTAKLQTPTGPTVAGQAVSDAQAAQQPPEAPPEAAPPEQQGIASILGQVQNAAPTLEQNQQNDQAKQTAQMAAQMMQQGQQTQEPPQQYAEGGIASLPVDVSDFAEGGVIGYAGGGITAPTPTSILEWMNSLAPKPDEEMEKEEKRLYEEQKLLRASRPDTAAQRALGMKEAYNKELAYRPTEEAIGSFLGGAQGLGGFAKAAINTREVFAKRDAANREGEQAQRDLEYAQKIGDNDAIQKALAARRNAKLEYDKLSNAIAGDSIKSQTDIYSTQVQAQSAAANRAAQERIAKLGADVRGSGADKAFWDKVDDNTARDLDAFYKTHPEERIKLRKNPELEDIKRAEIRKRVIEEARALYPNIPLAAAVPTTSAKPGKSYDFSSIN